LADSISAPPSSIFPSPSCRQIFHLAKEHVEDLVANRLDMSVRFGNLPDGSLVVRNIRPNRRVLVASGAYLTTTVSPPRLPI
jgi:DNA-binding transcriptional LysR family regulator